MEKAIIYLRTSTKDQNPELQREDCVKFCNDRGLEVIEVVSEQGSAYKLEKVRPGWESVVKRAKKEKINIVVWQYDRASRNRKEFFEFMRVMFETYNVKVYSAKSQTILTFWNMVGKKHTEDPVMGEFLKGLFKVVWELMINMAGEQSEEESKKKSDRVKMAVRKSGGVTISYKGKRWGRKRLPKSEKRIIESYEAGKNMRQICEAVYYWDKNNHKKHVSLGLVHKTIAKFKEEKNISKAREKN